MQASFKCLTGILIAGHPEIPFVKTEHMSYICQLRSKSMYNLRIRKNFPPEPVKDTVEIEPVKNYRKNNYRDKYSADSHSALHHKHPHAVGSLQPPSPRPFTPVPFPPR